MPSVGDSLQNDTLVFGDDGMDEAASQASSWAANDAGCAHACTHVREHARRHTHSHACLLQGVSLALQDMGDAGKRRCLDVC